MRVWRGRGEGSQSVVAWMASERLYEEYLFFYVLILVFWGAVGFFAFGFELPGCTQPENLFYNFLLFIALAAAMAFTPFWYRLVFGTQARLERRSREIWDQVEAIADDEKREAIKTHLANDGALPPRHLQKWCLIGLAWFALFELFFVSAWVKDMQLIWQPEWVRAVIAWVRENTTLPPLYVDRKLFTLKLDTDGFLAGMFANEKDFLNSGIGETVMLFRAWRTLVFFPSLIFMYIIINKVLGWVGLNYFRNFRVDGYWNHDKISKFLLFSFFLFQFFFLPLVMGCYVIWNI